MRDVFWVQALLFSQKQPVPEGRGVWCWVYEQRETRPVLRDSAVMLLDEDRPRGDYGGWQLSSVSITEMDDGFHQVTMDTTIHRARIATYDRPLADKSRVLGGGE
jgi:hypothetical protein